MIKPIATDIYTFSELIDRGVVYVDKTDKLLDLIAGSSKQFLLARPRQFGKSLTVSTLQAIFEGRRELFKGLAIDRSDYDWKAYPVIRLDMGSCQAATLAEFREFLFKLLQSEAARLGVTLQETTLPSVAFRRLIAEAARLSPEGQCVVLVDEYDKPLLAHLGTPSVEVIRDELKPFYGVIKYAQEFERFAFITGVSKFSKVSIFSDLNNLVDLTMDARTATMLGYTHDEVKKYFGEHLAALGEANGLTPEGAFDKVIAMYDGYRFEENAERVVNPVSFGRCLSDKKFKSYWYETGTPTFLMELMKKRPMDISNLEISEDELGSYEPANPEIVPLLFQTGYLTIKSMDTVDDLRLYRLGFPNGGVRAAFNRSLVSAYTNVDEFRKTSAQVACIRALQAHDLEAFFESLSVFFADIPYDLTDRQNEQAWQAILVTLLTFVGAEVRAEERTNLGRIDAVVTCPEEIYVVEVKLDKTAAEALAQIKGKHYHEKYLASGKRITLVGMNFSSEKRAVDDWTSEVVA